MYSVPNTEETIFRDDLKINSQTHLNSTYYCQTWMKKDTVKVKFWFHQAETSEVSPLYHPPLVKKLKALHKYLKPIYENI